MALIEFNDNVQARRLELDGYPRKGKKSVEASLEDLREFLEDEDKEVNKVALRRRNGDEEAEVIDSWIQKKTEGKYRTVTKAYTTSYAKNLNLGTSKVFRLKEDSITVYRQFEDVLFNQEYSEVENRDDVESQFEEMKQKHVEKLQEKVEEAKEKLEEAEQETFENRVGEAV